MLGGLVGGGDPVGNEAVDDELVVVAAVAVAALAAAAVVVAALVVDDTGWPAQATVIVANNGHLIVEGWPRADEPPSCLRGAPDKGVVRQARADLTSWGSIAMPGRLGTSNATRRR